MERNKNMLGQRRGDSWPLTLKKVAPFHSLIEMLPLQENGDGL